MKKDEEILYFEKVSDLYTALGMPLEQDTEFTIHELTNIHKTATYKSPVFRTNYYSFVFVKEGAGNYTTDEQTFEYTSRTIYFTNPGHLKAFEFYELGEVYLITLSEAFLKTNVHSDVFNEFPFLLAETVAPQTLSKENFSVFEQLCNQILKEYQSQSPYKNRIIGNLMVVLLLKIKEQFWEGYTPIEEGDRSSQIVKKFKLSLEQHFKDLSSGDTELLFQVQDFAREQNLNVSYFSQVIKSKTGKSISHWIAEKTIAQAKALLKHSQKTIKEIAYDLGFSETAHFSNFFKKHTGTSPTNYRLEFEK